MTPTTLTQARDAVIALVHSTLQTHLPTLPVEYDNTASVDVATVGPQFLQVDVEMEDSMLATVSDDLIDKVEGTAYFRLFTQVGKGTRSTLQIFDTLNSHLRHKHLNNVVTGSSTFGKKVEKDGWVSHDLLLPFEFWRST
jgi:hypothetical protein